MSREPLASTWDLGSSASADFCSMAVLPPASQHASFANGPLSPQQAVLNGVLDGSIQSGQATQTNQPIQSSRQPQVVLLHGLLRTGACMRQLERCPQQRNLLLCIVAAASRHTVAQCRPSVGDTRRNLPAQAHTAADRVEDACG